MTKPDEETVDLEEFISRVKKIKAYRTDLKLFAAEELMIVNKAQETVPLVFNRLQERLWSEVQKDLASGKPTRIYLLKARQLGSSTFCQALLFWLAVLRKNTNALVVAHDIDSAAELFTKCKIFYLRLDKQYRPVRKLSNRRELVFAKDDEHGDDAGLNSSVSIATANNTHLGASRTLTAIHLSEFARYESVQQNVALSLATLLNTVPKQPNTFVIIETTAWGLNYSYELWSDPESTWLKIFIPWLADKGYTASEPLDEQDLEASEDTRYGNEIHELSRVSEVLEEWWGDVLTDSNSIRTEALCRLKWRREKIDLELLGRADLFNQEYPTTAEDAFLTTGTNVFDTKKLADIRSAIVDSGDIPDIYRWSPQKRNLFTAKYGDFRQYRAPETGGRYVIGCDVGEGLDEKTDWSTATVLSVPDFEQVAQYQGHCNPSQFADVLKGIGDYYNQAFLIVEVNGPGLATNYKLGDDLRYPNLYRRVRRDKKTRQIQRIYGWHTNVATKSVMITDLRQALFEDLIILRDLQTLDELGWYIQDQSGKFNAASTKNDDLVISLALAWQLVKSEQYAYEQRPKRRPPPGPGTLGYISKQLVHDNATREVSTW